MHSVHRMCGQRYHLMSLLASLLMLCLFILAGCGYSNGGGTQSATSNGGPGPRQGQPIMRPTGAPPVTTSGGSTQGCPSSTMYTTDPVKANVVVKPGGSNVTVHAHVGDIIEIQLPFGKRWGGPQSDQGNLALEQPYGYGLKSDSTCVWRFTAHDAGTTALQFTSRPLCKMGQMCPMYIAVLPIMVAVSQK